MLQCTLQINKKLLPMKMHYFIATAGSASINPFMSTTLRQRGYSSFLVSLIFTVIPLLGLLIRPVVGGATDKYKCRKSAFYFSIIATCLLICVLMFIPGTAVGKELDDVDVLNSSLFWLFFGTVILFSITLMVRGVLDDTICIGLLGKNIHTYGEQRVWATIGWGTISVVSGLCVDWYSNGQEHKNYLPAYIISLICFLLDIYVISNIEVEQNSDNKIIMSDIKNVITNIKVQLFYFWSIGFGFFNAIISYYVFWYLEDLSNIYHPETKPWIKTIQGFTLTIQCFGGEVPSFFLSSFILKRVDPMHVFSLMFFTFAARFFLYSYINNPVWVLPVELLHGITFAMTYSAAISFVAHVAPSGAEGVIQGILGTFVQGIGLPSGAFVGGYLFRQFGSINSFTILGYMAIITCVTQIIINQLVNCFSKNEKDKRDMVQKIETTDVDENL